MAKGRKEKEEVGELTTVPNEKYQKLFDKFAEVDTLDIEQWKVAHILGYFCKKYKETYGVDYQFKFNHVNPAKCFEVWQVNTLCAKLSANPKILRDYIDWVYKEKVARAKRRLTSISFITQDYTVNEYKWNVLLVDKKQLHLTRSSELSVTYQETLAANGFKIKTYGDLAFLYHATKAQGLEINMADKFNDTLKEMCAEGFDASVLDRIT